MSHPPYVQTSSLPLWLDQLSLEEPTGPYYQPHYLFSKSSLKNTNVLWGKCVFF